MACAVGDTLVEGAVLLRVHGAGTPLPEDALRAAVRLGRGRTFEQVRNIRSGFSSISRSRRYRRRSTTHDRSPDHRSARGSPAPPRRGRIGRRLRRRRNRRLAAGLSDPDLGGLLTLAFDEIRQFGSSSVQVLRRMRSAFVGLWIRCRAKNGLRRCGDISNISTMSSRPRRSTSDQRMAPGRSPGDRPVPPPRRHRLRHPIGANRWRGLRTSRLYGQASQKPWRWLESV